MVHIKHSATFVLAAAAIAPVVAQPIQQGLSRSNAVYHQHHTKHVPHELSGASGVSNAEHHHTNHGAHAIVSPPDSSLGDVQPDVAPSPREYVDSLHIRETTSPAGSTAGEGPSSHSPGQGELQNASPPQAASEIQPGKPPLKDAENPVRLEEPKHDPTSPRARASSRYRSPNHGGKLQKRRRRLGRRLRRKPVYNVHVDPPTQTPPSPTSPSPLSSPVARREYIDLQDLFERSMDELEFQARDFADFDDLHARYFEDEFYLD
jgi:hypothetical protein